jgi:hypothetical protein
MGIGGLYVFYYVGLGLLVVGAGLLDLVLLPFRPLMPATYYVDTFAVAATRAASRTPVHVDHYVINSPSAGDWCRITTLTGALSPMMNLQSAPYGGARELFIRSPTSMRPSAFRKLADYRTRQSANGHIPGATPPGRTEPAAIVRVDRLEAGTGDVRAGLASFIDATRTGPSRSGLLSSNPGRYQVARNEQSFIQVSGMPCVRDEFVYLWMDDPTRKDKASRNLASTLACADPACPDQAVSLVVRGKADAGGDLEREARSFLASLRVDPAVAPVCAAR